MTFNKHYDTLFHGEHYILRVYGQVSCYKGIGRPPTKQHTIEGWQYRQIVKHRDEHGRFLDTTKRVVSGAADKVEHLSEATFFVERPRLTSRQMNARRARKGLGFSKVVKMRKVAAVWEDALYNLVRLLKTLREEVDPRALRFERRYKNRAPAMAAGLTDHVWSVKELTNNCSPTQQHLSGRLSKGRRPI